MTRPREMKVWMILLVAAVIFFAYYLSRWDYTYYGNTRIRVDRLTGTTEMRVLNADGTVDWVAMDGYQNGKPVGQ